MKKIRKFSRVRKRIAAGALAFVMGVSGIVVPSPVYGSNVWPQKSTAPFYCLDGGKSWRAADRYEIFEYDTLPSALTEVQAKRLFWAYPSNWNALKEASAVYDPELYHVISGVGTGPNVVKKVKDDPNTAFAWVADHPEIEERAIRALERNAGQNNGGGKQAPEVIKNATSEESAAPISVPSFQDGPASLDTEVVLGSEFVGDIAKIEMESIWDNGSNGGRAGWVDASQEKNQIKTVMGSSLYEITWSGDSIKIHNNGSVLANEAVIGKKLSEEERYNKTTIRYKITMRENSGWCTEGCWNEDYLHQWMDFKGCVNEPGHQRLYVANIQIMPSEMAFYFVVSQGEAADMVHAPEYGTETVEVPFQLFRHEETFESTYHVKLKKLDDETNMPLKGSQFYLFERFDSADMLGDHEEDGGLNREKLSFQEWNGFQVFSEGTTDINGEIVHTDSRNYLYSKTYCDGHRVPDWSVTENESDSETDEEGCVESGDEDVENKKDANRQAAEKWLELVDVCSETAGNSGGTHFHWLQDAESYEEVQRVLESGETGADEDSEERENFRRSDLGSAFERSGCKSDCEQTYENFINLRFSYTWKEVQARNGYILHGIHPQDQPIEIISTNSSEAGADAVRMDGNSGEIIETVWYAGNNEKNRQIYQLRKEVKNSKEKPEVIFSSRLDDATNSNAKAVVRTELRIDTATSSNAATNSNAKKRINFPSIGMQKKKRNLDDEDWEYSGSAGEFDSYLECAETDHQDHIEDRDSGRFSYADLSGEGGDCWIVTDHRTEGEIHINKRDMDLYEGESEQYSSYGDTEGDGTLKGAVYGLFAAEDIRHPDSDFMENGLFTNTGVV